ncbi:UNVERIFIED_CONTAM: hypothetical protein Sangu_3127100 [Sesamum angustifolium]|uniref:Reverse transcriptase domain-containing protein n=1 Tax=Sesamum angustifolium TaxID=2727405 RepID=A0AAW2K122_9LAMI
MTPEMVSHFRPISMCNIIYKITSKSIGNRLNGCLDSIISESNQLSLVEEPSLIMSSSHMKLSTILLFHIYAETFSKLLQATERRAEIKGVVVARRALRILHLFFVDDSLILCQATLGALQSIREILRIYERASGEVINLQKSKVIFSSNTPEELRPQLTRIMNVRVVEKFDKYFGLLSIVGRSKLEIFNSLCECIWKRVLGWKEKLLSQAGKEVLIKFVLTSYSYLCDELLSSVGLLLTKIESILSNFWWNNNNENKIHWVARHQLCDNKRERGLDFKDLRSFSMSMLAKQASRLVTKPNSLLSRVLQARWRVGDGNSIAIWHNRWVPKSYEFKLIMLRGNLSEDASVHELTCSSSRRWNLELLQQNFDKEDIDNIIAIPLARSSLTDRIIWHYLKHGRLLVNSAYILARDMAKRHSHKDIGQSHAFSDGGFSCIWSCRVPTRSKYSCGVYAISNPHNLKSPAKEVKHQFKLLVMWTGWRG